MSQHEFLSSSETIDLFSKYVFANYTRYPVVLVRGKGSYVWDADGKKYLDMFPGWAVSGLGHCHPRVVKAVREQVGTLIHVANNFYMEPQGRLAKLLSEHSFGGRCFFCNSGAEANEAAIKLARISTPKGKYKFVTFENSFHGRTLAAISATAQPKYHAGFEPIVEGFTYVPFNNLQAVANAVDDATCAVMVEPIQGEGGINVATPEFLQGLRRLCDDRGLRLIFDEVQTGMGRTGQYFAYQVYNVTPDMMTLAKALGGGVPIGALVAKSEIAAHFVPGTHASTFGGNPLVTSAAIAVFEAIEQEGLLANARTLGDYVQSQLRKMAKRQKMIREVRGVGLMIGIQLDREGADIVKKCLERGLLINCTHGNVLRFMPAMTAGKREVNAALRILKKVLSEVA